MCREAVSMKHKMVKTFQAYLPEKCHRLYSCVHCRAHLANHDELISKVRFNLSLCVRKPTIWIPTRSDTNQSVQLQKMVRSLKFWILKVEELYYPCSENKGADQLRSYCEADLRLCFRICKVLVFSCTGSFSLLLSWGWPSTFNSYDHKHQDSPLFLESPCFWRSPR